MTGEKLSQAGWLSSSESGSKGLKGEAEFTSSSGSVRALSVNREIGTERPGTIRNRSEPDQVIQARFELE